MGIRKIVFYAVQGPQPEVLHGGFQVSTVAGQGRIGEVKPGNFFHAFDLKSPFETSQVNGPHFWFLSYRIRVL